MLVGGGVSGVQFTILTINKWWWGGVRHHNSIVSLCDGEGCSCHLAS